MSATAIIVITLALGIIVGGVMVLKKSATKFDLTKEQLDEIKNRNEAINKQEESEE